jgi:hypothetical protein
VVRQYCIAETLAEMKYVSQHEWGTSEKFTHAVYINLGPPLAPLTSCSLSDSVGDNLKITINWDTSFNSQYNVERYQVAVTPDPTPSCAGSVSPNMSYTCSGLNSDTDYTITVSATNCGDQEGMSSTFSVQSRLLGMYDVGWSDQSIPIFT